MNKKIITAFFTAVMAAAAVLPMTGKNGGTTITAGAEIQYGSWGDFKYKTNYNNTLDITDYTGSASNISIPAEINGIKVTGIGLLAFKDCTAESITIPDGVTLIYGSAFENCDNLKSINIPESVAQIANLVFADCDSLTEITVPASLTDIGDGAFSDCDSLRSIKVSEDNPGYCSENGMLFSKDKTVLTAVPAGITGGISVPSGVTALGNYAFCGCELKGAALPEGLQSIGDNCFSDCEQLMGINIPDSVTYIGEDAFSRCLSISSVKIPKGVTAIGDYAFRHCISLSQVSLPAGLKSIGVSAFYNCYTLSSVNIPIGLTGIGARAFYGCTDLKSVTVPKTVESIGNYALGYDLYDKLYDNFRIYCYTDTEGQRYASSNGIAVNILKTSVTECQITLSSYSEYFRGERIKPAVTVKDNGRILIKDVDYTLSYENNLTAGTASVGIKGMGNYSGTIEKNYRILPRNIANCDIRLSSSEYTFNGSRIKPSVSVYSGSVKLDSGNYTVSYSDNLSAGTGRITVKGKNNLTGTAVKTFSIKPRSVYSCTVALGATELYFNGSRIKPSVKVYCGGTEIYGANYSVSYTDNLSAGTGKVTVKGTGNLIGTKTVTFKIKPRNISNCDIKLSQDKYYFTGARIRPEIKSVNIGNKTVYSGNYKAVSYAGNLAAGTGTVVIEGTGNLSGRVTKTFRIAPRSVASCTVSLTRNTSDKYRPAVTVCYYGRNIYSGNYTVSYKISSDKKTVTVTVSGKNNLTGKVSKTYRVV
ncbi:MAG: leucine-rich repeat domain-containing protein [Ruminococcus sp.]|nr:leucine-rich repeat domain-containing protein [Ruminococcus sp.]